MAEGKGSEIQSARVLWQDILPHARAGDFFEVSGRSAQGPFVLVLQPDMGRRLSLVYAKSARRVLRPDAVSLVQNTTLRLQLDRPELIPEVLHEAREAPESMLTRQSELVISNVFSLTTGQSLCLAGVVHSLKTRLIKPWEIPARAADEALLADLSLEADVAHLAEKVREVLQVSQLTDHQLKAGVCYVMGQWGGHELSCGIDRALAILVVESFDRHIALARFLEQLSLNPIMHARIVRNAQGELVLLCPDAVRGTHQAVQMERQNAMLSLLNKDGDLADVLKIEQVVGPAATVCLHYLPSTHFQNVLVWCLPEGKQTTPTTSRPANLWIETGAGRLRLMEGRSTVGRWSGVEIQINDPSVSARHCELFVADDHVVVRDLGSTNGTFVDGVRIDSQPVPLRHFLQVGSVRCPLHHSDIDIVIPTLSRESGPVIVRGPDGWPMCQQDSQRRATHQCSKCELPFHYENARQVGLIDSPTRLLFCPECDSALVELSMPSRVDGFLRNTYRRLVKLFTDPPSPRRRRARRR